MLNEFIKFLNRSPLAPSSQKTYAAIVRKIRNENSDLDVYQYRDIIKLMGKMQCDFYGTAFPHTTLAALKHYFNFLIDIGKRESHPCYTMRLRYNLSKEIMPTDLFSMSELHLLMRRTERYKELELRNKLLISFLIYQAAVPSELAKAQLNDIDRENQTILLRGNLSVSRRKIKLLPHQMNWLEDYSFKRKQVSSKNNSSLLLGKLGNGITTDDIHYLISTSQHLFPDRKLSVPMIRKSVIAFWLNSKKIPLEQVQLLAGHRWISSTQRYHFPDFESDKKMLRKLHPLG